MVKLVLLAFFFLVFPLFIIYMCQKWAILNKLGSIVIAYGFGLLLGTSGLLPKGGTAYEAALNGRAFIPKPEMETFLASGNAGENDNNANRVAMLQDLIPSVMVPLAFPLLLFSLNIRRWIRFARKGFISVVLALISGLVMVTAGFFIFRNVIPEAWKLAGMFVGIYTGGTPNFVALSMALDVSPNTFILTSTYDMMVGAFLVLFFITIAPRIFRTILPAYHDSADESTAEIIENTPDDLESYRGFFKKETFLHLLGAFTLSVAIFLVAFGLSLLLPSIPQMVVVILTITTLGIIASLNKYFNQIEKTFQLGMYLIMVFSFTVASMADLKTMFSIGVVNLILFITWVYFGSLVLHLILARIFRVDADNFLITATAFIFSPPFVPLVAGALRNKDVIVTGITGGIIGYILGNYFGVGLAYFLKGF
jgi:uncharacterized membrane protein